MFNKSDTVEGMNVEKSVPKTATQDKNNKVAETNPNEKITSCLFFNLSSMILPSLIFFSNGKRMCKMEYITNLTIDIKK